VINKPPITSDARESLMGSANKNSSAGEPHYFIIALHLRPTSHHTCSTTDSFENLQTALPSSPRTTRTRSLQLRVRSEAKVATPLTSAPSPRKSFPCSELRAKNSSIVRLSCTRAQRKTEGKVYWRGKRVRTRYKTHVMMSGEAWLYLLAVLINAVNLFLQVFFTIMYSDLEW
jgi:hypothetical protein